MEICVAGFYFDRDFIEILRRSSEKHKITIISHRKAKDFVNSREITCINIPNIGLEFGCYDHYLKNVWDGGKTLFIHDDMKIGSINIFDKIEEVDKDCAYIFRDECEEKANGGKHGRAILASSRFLQFIKDFRCDCDWGRAKPDQHNKGSILPYLGPHRGFWFDLHNHGHVAGKPPIGVRHYNEGIYHFHWMLGRIRDQRCGDKRGWPCPQVKMDVVNRIFFDEVMAGRRNCWKHIEREIYRYKEAQ